MWPPMPASFLFWPWTMAMAFQRMRDSTRRFKGAVAGVGHFVVLGDGVAVRRAKLVFCLHAGFACALPQCAHQLRALLRTFCHDHLVKGFDPLCDLVLQVGVRGGDGGLRSHGVLQCSVN